MFRVWFFRIVKKNASGVFVTEINGDAKSENFNHTLIYGRNGECIINFSTTKSKEFSFSGKIYPFMEGLYEGKVIVGEFFDPEKDYEISNFKIELKEKPVLSYSVYDIEENVSRDIEGQISIGDFKELYDKSVKEYSDFYKDSEYRMKYLDKIVHLHLQIKDDFSAPTEGVFDSDKLASIDVDESKSFARSLKTDLDDFSYSELRNFILTLKSSGTSGVYISTHGIDEAFFTTEGTQFQHSWSTPSFLAAKKTVKGLNHICYTKISMMDLQRGYSPIYGGINIFMRLDLKYGVMIEYVEGSGIARLYLDNNGLKLYRVKLAITKLRNSLSAIFKNRVLSADITAHHHDVTGLVAMVPYGQYVAGVWNFFSVMGTDQFVYSCYDFGDSVSEQLERYGEIVKGISMNTHSTIMFNEGDYVRISGDTKHSGLLWWTTAYSYWVKY